MQSDPSHKDSGFRLPDGYFDALEERIRERMKIQQTEDQLPKKEGFAVPGGYFEKLESRILEKTTQPDSGVIPLNRKLWKYAVAAAIVVLAVTSTWMIQKNSRSSTFENLPIADIEWLLEQGGLEIPQQFLLEEANTPLLMELTMAENMLDAELLENYLSEEADLYELMD